jgi:hypothetical protein
MHSMSGPRFCCAGIEQAITGDRAGYRWGSSRRRAARRRRDLTHELLGAGISLVRSRRRRCLRHAAARPPALREPQGPPERSTQRRHLANAELSREGATSGVIAAHSVNSRPRRGRSRTQVHAIQRSRPWIDQLRPSEQLPERDVARCNVSPDVVRIVTLQLKGRG